MENQGNGTFDPRAIHQFVGQPIISQRESERAASDIRFVIEPANENRDAQNVNYVAPVSEQSNPSTIYDRGNSERLRDNCQDHARGSELLEFSESEVAGAGGWLDAPEMVKRLYAALEVSKDGKDFLPIDKLEAIVTKEAVEQELTRCRIPNASTLAQDICLQHKFQESYRTQYTSYQKIFAILVLMDEVQYISDFLNQRIRDSDLPLKEHKMGSTTCLVARHVEENPSSDYLLQTTKAWSVQNILSFGDQQWKVCAPFFARAENLGEKVHLYSLSTRDVLPFVSPGTDDQDNPQYLYQGTFSTVRRVKIHHAHHNFSVHRGNPGADFVVKEIIKVSPSSGYRESFAQEVHALKRFCQRNERYIIKLLATYEIDGTFHLLFPAADGNLMNHWEEYSSPETVPNSALWLVQECLGIAQALQKIHKFTYSPIFDTSFLAPADQSSRGIHGDIKPQNILWFKALPGHLQNDPAATPQDHVSEKASSSGLGYLQISDFGTVKFHRYISMRGNEIQVRGNTYRAPEADLPENLGSPALDVWAYGCLCLELITWYLRGEKGVCENFPKARQADEPRSSIEGYGGEDKFFIAKTNWLTGRQYSIVKPRVSEREAPYMDGSDV
ncbi:hypothetical protein Hte_008721 [Hypoxylon texense]